MVTRVDNIEKSPEDKRLYRGLKLHNGLKVMLVSDAETDKAAVSLDVHVGYMSDPKSLPGLAHFLEHMLFLGTEKYPDENEYNRYLSQHGGESNAYTATDHTNFYFDITPAHMEGAMDRFAQFFLKPLFTESMTAREVNAVNSEHEKNVASDGWRLNQLEKMLADEEHDYHKFGSGNKDTLGEGKDGVREALLKFHSTYYSSNIMTLAVLSQHSLEDLETMVVGLFSGVEDKNVSIPNWANVTHPFTKNAGSWTEAVPVKDFRSLNLTWAIPDLTEYYNSSPGHYLGHLIGHEGKGSLLSELKAKGWANSLVGGQKQGAKGFDFFIVNVDLTEDGLEHVEDVASLAFAYIRLMAQDGLQERIFAECRDLNAMLFRFKDKERPQNYVGILSTRMHDYPLEEILTGPYSLKEWRPDLVKDLVLDRLKPNSVFALVVSQKFDDTVDGLLKTEPWYGTKYTKKNISEATLQKWSEAASNSLHMPAKNEFIPTDFELKPRDTLKVKLPQILAERPLSRLWYKQDDEFLLPKACLTFELRSPLVYADPVNFNLANMLTSVVIDAMTEVVYSAELAGLVYGLEATKYGLTLSMQGYHDKQAVLLDKLASALVGLDIDEARFNVLKESYLRSLRNFAKEQPYTHSMYNTNVLLAERVWTKTELLEAATPPHGSLTLEALKDFIPRLFSSPLHVEALVHGNVGPEDAINLLDVLEAKLNKAKPLPLLQRLKGREAELEKGTSMFHVVQNDVHKSSCVEMYLQCGLQATRPNTQLELLAQILNEPTFNVLRTKEQLGYIVQSGVRQACGVQGLRVIVQSDRNPNFVESRIEAFLGSMRSHLEDMSQEEFDRHREALASRKLEKPKRMATRTYMYWSEISSKQFNFDRVDVEVEELRRLTKQDILDFYDQHVKQDGPLRRKLSSHVQSTLKSEKEEEQEQVVHPCGQQVSDIVAFKASLPLSALPKPFVDPQTLKRPN